MKRLLSTVKVGEGHFESINGNQFSLDEDADVDFGEDTNVSSRAKIIDNQFTEKINYLTIDSKTALFLYSKEEVYKLIRDEKAFYLVIVESVIFANCSKKKQKGF